MKTEDNSNGAKVIAVIKMKEGKYIFDAQAEDEISDFLYEKIEEKLHGVTGIPLFMEASAWCTFASVGDIYEKEEFKIEVRSR